ncbi:MAG: Na(+)-translocating NADH-quinone reductase subunit C [Calditrichia bacterium]
MQVDSIKNILIVALGVCLICSILVSGAAVSLSGIQAENRKLDKLKNILEAGQLLKSDEPVEKVYREKIEAVLVDLSTGQTIPEAQQTGLLNIETFDIPKVAGDAQLGYAIPANEDIAQIKRRPKNMPVYLVKNGDAVEKIILPIYGKGLWSTMYGFLALDSDLKTVRGITFYQHGETPGLGGEVDNPRWKSQWNGKKAFDDSGDVIINVIKGAVDPNSPASSHQIDGLSGATITTRGVDKLIEYWLSDTGYGKYLETLKTEVNNG